MQYATDMSKSFHCINLSKIEDCRSAYSLGLGEVKTTINTPIKIVMLVNRVNMSTLKGLGFMFEPSKNLSLSNEHKC